MVTTPAGTEGTEALRRTDAAMRRVRWLGVAFVLVQFALYQPPPGWELPWARWPVALTLAGVLAVVNLGMAALSRRADAAALRRWGMASWAADSAVILALVWLFSFDDTSALWALLVIPVLEGALRLQLRGALTAWAVLSAGYLVRDVWASAHYAHLEFMPESQTYRMGIVLCVAMTAGMLARNLQLQIEAFASAHASAERRAELLAVVANAGRRLSEGVEEIIAGVADAAMRLGFDACEVCVLDEEEPTYRVRCERGMPAAYQRGAQPVTAGIAGQAIVHGTTMVIEDYASWPEGDPVVREEGFHTVVATPVFCGGEVAGVLAAGFRDAQRRITRDEIDGVELLAAHAGAALEQQRRVADRATYEARLSHQAYHDPLTELPNRTLFTERLDEAVLSARWNQSQLAVLYLDLDRFKTVNDSLGHEAGDQLLRAVAARLTSHLREGDLVARLGGDEFTVLIQGDNVRGRAPRLARRLVQILHAPYTVDGRVVYITVSAGISYGPIPGSQGAELLRRADVAMYRAKELGRDRLAVYRPDMDDRLLRRLETETGVREALDRREFELHYQPMVSLATGELTGVEALLRWRRGDRLVGPADFLPAAEDTGLIVPLGHWVLREAVAQHCRWQRELGVAVPMYVNVSAQQLRQPHFTEDVEAALRETGMAPGQLVLEITEGGFIQDEEGIERLVRLRELGVLLALDDFGTGWSSLSRLRGLPVDVLKVDRGFVARLPGDQRSEAIVRSLVALARELGMSVTAEGVEHEAQRVAVARLGCSVGQGWHFGRPMPADALAPLIAEQSLAGGGGRRLRVVHGESA